MKKRFHTIFPLSYNVHLMKDVGMIPYILYRDFGYDSTLVTFKNEEKYEALEREVKGLKIYFLPKDKKYIFTKPSLKVIVYLLKYSHNIHVLNLYHNTQATLVYGIIYRLMNPSGVLYVKLDINIDKYKQTITSIKKYIFSLFYKYILSIASYELKFVGNYLLSEYPILRNKLIKLPNGIDDKFIMHNHISIRNYNEKENLIITVGRIGISEKNHEMLLDVLSKIDLKSWKVAFIGPVEKDFECKIDKFYNQNPHLVNIVSFVGSIDDRVELYSWYNKAKIFCLTSKWESFGIVLVEALYFGNYIITTEISPADEITDGNSIGSIIKNENDMRVKLQEIINDEKRIALIYNKIINKSKEYYWENNLEVLHKKISQINA